MKKNNAKYFLFFVIFITIKCDEDNCKDNEYNNTERSINNTLSIKQTIIEHASYYPPENGAENITDAFIDFYEFRFYYINMTQIIPDKENEVVFHFSFKNETETWNGFPRVRITIECKENFTCNNISLDKHKFISFDFDYLISLLAGPITFFLVMVGIFCLRYGYIYYNIPTAFYSGLSVFLFWREFCELLELNDKLNTLHTTSSIMATTVFVFSIITSIAYGYISIKTKYLKYISFGFIDGLIFAKVLYFCILIGLDSDNKVLLCYFLTEIISCIGFIVFFILFRNKNLIITIGNISILASYGILYGFHILIGGIPFLPFCILSRSKFIDSESKLKTKVYETLSKGNKIGYYIVAFFIIAIGGFFLNYTNYKLFMEKKKKNISTL